MDVPSRSAPCVLAIALGLLAAGPASAGAQAPPAAAAAGEHHHVPAVAHGDADAHAHHGGHPLDSVGLEVPDGHVRWIPDAPLLEGMRRVRTAVADLDAQPAPAREPAAVAASAAEVDAAIAYMFANCELAPEPDVALHAILARLMAGIRALRADPADAGAVEGMRAAVDHYHALFDDPAH